MSRYEGKTPPGCLSGTGMAWLYTVSRFLEVLFEKPFGESRAVLSSCAAAARAAGAGLPRFLSTGTCQYSVSRRVSRLHPGFSGVRYTQNLPVHARGD